MIALDGTPNKSRLGANAILGVSLAVAKAAAEASGLPLYRYVGGTTARVLPTPMMNIVNGGVHADNPIDFQEFMILPVGAPSLRRRGALGRRTFHALKSALKKAGHNTNVGDEGGFAPNLPSAEAALDFCLEGDRGGGIQAGPRISRSASTAPPPNSSRTAPMSMRAKVRRARSRTGRLSGQAPDVYPILSIEDGMAEQDWGGWKLLTEKIGAKRQLVGDDIFVTNAEILSRGIKEGREFDPHQGQPDRHRLAKPWPRSRWRIAPATPP